MLLSAGVRILEQTARCALIDNAKGFERTASHCDLDRETQRARHDKLVELKWQQEEKARLLRHRLEQDATNKRPMPGGSQHCVKVHTSRWRADVRANVGLRVASDKEHERKRAAAHNAKIAEVSAATRMYVEADDAALVLTVHLNRSGNVFEMTLTKLSGKTAFETKFNTNATLADIRGRVAKYLREKFRLVTPSGVALDRVRSDFPITEFATLTDDEVGAEDSGDDGDGFLTPSRPRTLMRKKPNAKQRARQSRNRKQRKVERLAEHKIAYLAATSKAKPCSLPPATHHGLISVPMLTL